ncbi:MAG: hypothetical protein IKM32_01410 [Clostridia bacterium]|nr:hypothetical protein [Clostridia bacterium]
MKTRTHRARITALLLALLMLVAVFAACGDSESSSSEVIGESSTAAQESSKTEKPESSQAVSSEDSSEASSEAESSEVESSESESDASNETSDESLGETSEEGSGETSEEPEINAEDRSKAFRLSSIDDLTDDNGERSYTVFAPYTDKYTLKGENLSSITISKNGEELKSGKTELSVSLKADEAYTLTVKTKKANADFKITTTASEHSVLLPYDVAAPVDTSKLVLDNDGESPLVAAEVNYIKREGGTYVYSNNPEQFGAQHVGKAFMRNEGLEGEVYVTFEHANYAGKNVYLGYQLKNDSDHDVYITVLNVGYQHIGTWFGQLAWYKFYNTSFELPADYFTASGAISAKYAGLDYAYVKYQPRVYQPTTYRLPAGEYMWVIGGTSADAYRNINVDNSANYYVNPIRCANGNVKFSVTGGMVTGTMYCYTDASQVQAEPKALGYVGGAYSQQYSGIAYHHGVIDNYMSWTFNDNTSARFLPVTYTTYYSDSVLPKTPYASYNSTPHTVKSTTWMTHLNPQNNHQAVGMDMVEFIWHDAQGNLIVFDNHRADGAGAPANTANWMIEYQDHFTFVNQGDTDRKITLHLRDHGTLAILVRDSKTGEVLSADYTAGLGENGGAFSNYKYEITVPAHSVKQITLDYLLVACSYGSVTHAVKLD